MIAIPACRSMMRLRFMEELELTGSKAMIADRILKEIRSRLGFLRSVGLEYLTLQRSAATLSGGESQRIRLATQIGSSLMGVLYILDEPSIGLHQRDNDKLLDTLKHLRDLGNTLIVVEHDEDTMRAADYIVDVGPGAGIHGGEIVAAGTPEEVAANPKSLTGLYLARQKECSCASGAPQRKRKLADGARCGGEQSEKYRRVHSAGCLYLCYRRVRLAANPPWSTRSCTSAWPRSSIADEGAPGQARQASRAGEHLDKVIDIDQSPIGRTPRSNPATYTGVFNDIRELVCLHPGRQSARLWRRAAFPSTSRAAGAKPVRATGW